MRVDAFEIKEPVPELHNTCAIAMLTPWVNVGKVGSLALSKLEKHLDAKELGRLARPGAFYDFTRDRPRTRTVDDRRVLTIPNTVVYYGQDHASGKDYLFLHMREPHALGEDYSDAVVALLKHFDVTEYCRIGGFFDSVPHTRPLLVTATLSEAQREQAEGLVSPRRNTYQGPTSIVNLVNDGLEESGIATSSLMVHVPQYAQLDEDHLASSRLMEVLCAIYGFPTSLADSARGQQQYQYISRLVANNAEVTGIIKQLETEYDRARTGTEPEETEPEEKVSLPPNVENFLRQMGQRLDEGDSNQ